MEKRLINKLLFINIFVFLLSPTLAFSQLGGQIHGNFQTDVYLYGEDSLIGALMPSHKVGIMGYANFIYELENFSAGLRYEAYLNTPEGIDPRYDGQGIPYRFLQYSKDNYKIVVGNFYEQFGNGLVLRSYEDKTLGIDNSIDGILAHFSPTKGIMFKGLAGKQRFFWDKGAGIIRGIDGEVNMSELIKVFKSANLTFGASVVSKYEADLDPIYKLPENVLAFSDRISFSYKNFVFQSEYVFKYNDPSSDNNFIYQNGEALLFIASYTTKGFGIVTQTKSLYNMSFRSSRTANLNNLSINYIPAISKTQSYSLASMYPYASQSNGETGFQADIFFKIPKKTKIGGKYGTNISLNFSYVNSIKKTPISDTILIGQSGTLGYNAELFTFGDELYYRDFNVEVSKKFSKHLKTIFMFQNLFYNYKVLRGKMGENVFANLGVADITYRINYNNTIKTQLQALFTEQDYGDWAMGLFQYTFKRKWFVVFMDQYNYGNKDDKKRVHYYNFALGYTKGSGRIQLGYGKQREGMLCVGGVCREVPAMYGFTLSASVSF